jgi:hypothetical protein
MSLLDRLSDPGWRTTALLLLGMILLVAALRLREVLRIRRKFPRERIVRTSYAVTYFGLDSEPGLPKRILGALVLHKDGLYFRARVTRQELSIPAAAVTHVGVTDTHRGRTLRQYVVAVRFRTSAGQGDTAAFRFPLPALWIAALQATLTGSRS